MEYSDGIRPYILEWFHEVFHKAFEEKGDVKDSKTNSKGELLEESRVALTSQDLIRKHKEKHNESLTSHKLLQSYLYPLINHGYIDSIDSIIDKRAKIYYPIIETKKYINLFYSEEKNNNSQEINKIFVNFTIFPSKTYIISKIESMMTYYSKEGYFTTIKNSKEDISLETLVDQYFGNPEDYFEVKKETKEEKIENGKEQKERNEEERGDETITDHTIAVIEQKEIDRHVEEQKIKEQQQEETPEEKYKKEQEEMKKRG